MLKIGRPSPIKGCSAENQQHGAFTDRPLHVTQSLFSVLYFLKPVACSSSEQLVFLPP